MTPAVPLLNYRRTRYAQRLLGMPCDAGNDGPDAMLRVDGSELARMLMQASLIGRYEAERAWRPQGWAFPGLLMHESTLSSALATALEWEDSERIVWTDGSRLDNGKFGCSVIWNAGDGGWRGKSFRLGRNK
ncbi:hypothetical protein FPQ18DRAFT_384192 [Pyronema domesticum]|nr:hypothetical protein FPQ18DRAFT_384192 [Pyronema domesticum]